MSISNAVHAPHPPAAFFGGMGIGKASAAPWPVWRGSAKGPVKFQPLAKRQVVRLWHNARRFERQTRKPGAQDGAIGRNGLAVLHALLFDFLNYASGKLYPSRRAIAHKANVSLRSVDRGLAKLKLSGVVNWLRRCVEEWIDGRFTLKQETNAYAVLPAAQWKGFTLAPDAPAPDPGTWGDPAALPNALTLAAGNIGLGAKIMALESDERDGLAKALARFARTIAGRAP